MWSEKNISEQSQAKNNNKTDEIELLDLDTTDTIAVEKIPSKEEKISTITVTDTISSDIIEEVLKLEEEGMPENESTPKVKLELQLENEKKAPELQLRKQEKNLIRKSAILTKIELQDLCKQILGVHKLDMESRILINRFSEKYIDYKYFFEGEFIRTYTKEEYQEITKRELNFFAKELEQEKKYTKKGINRIKECFNIINEVDLSRENIGKALRRNNVLIDQAMKIKKTIANYDKIYNQFLHKLDSKKFSLVITRLGLSNIYISNVRVNIKFNPVFSKEGINKAFNNERVIEDLKNVQLKLLSIKTFEDWLNFSLKEEYYIYLPEALYKKSRKLHNLLKSINDSYSQNKIKILLDYNILISHIKTVTHLKKAGFHLILECNSEEIVKYNKIKKNLCMFDKIYIHADEKAKKKLEENIPNSMIKDIEYIDQELITSEGVIIS